MTQQPSLGSTLKAWLRQGSKEAAQVLPAFPDSIKPVEEPGMPGNLTQQEVYRQKQLDLDMEK